MGYQVDSVAIAHLVLGLRSRRRYGPHLLICDGYAGTVLHRDGLDFFVTAAFEKHARFSMPAGSRGCGRHRRTAAPSAPDSPFRGDMRATLPYRSCSAAAPFRSALSGRARSSPGWD